MSVKLFTNNRLLSHFEYIEKICYKILTICLSNKHLIFLFFFQNYVMLIVSIITLVNWRILCFCNYLKLPNRSFIYDKIIPILLQQIEFQRIVICFSGSFAFISLSLIILAGSISNPSDPNILKDGPAELIICLNDFEGSLYSSKASFLYRG